MSESHPYQDPVAQILKVDTPTNWQDVWIDYPTQYGLTKADVPELIRLAKDEELTDSESPSIYSGIHALRAAAQLDPETTFNEYLALLAKFPDDDYLHEEIRGMCIQVGEIAIAPLKQNLNNNQIDVWLRVSAANGLEEVSKAYPELRETCIQILREELQNYRDRKKDILDSTLITNLTELKAIEVVDLIAEVFSNRELDEFITGSWASVQVELGLKQESDFSSKQLAPKMPDYMLAWQKDQRQREFQKPLNEIVLPPRPVAKGFGSSKNKKKKK
ncbi:DUF1186 domain-containing protein [Pseudanabaena biceps]|nr:DUF1186 domain-containing protein [Pseudanabaena biceps]